MQLWKNRRSITWKQCLFLVIYGTVLGRLSFANLDMWGSGHDRYHQSLYGTGCLVGAMTFLAGVLGFLVIVVKALFSLTTLPSSVVVPKHPANVKRPVVVANSGKIELTSLRAVLVAALAVACLAVLRDIENPYLSNYSPSYYEPYRESAVLVLLMSQLPYAAGFILTWKIPRFALALVIAAGIWQGLIHLSSFSSPASFSGPWRDPSLLLFAFGCAIAALAYFAWRPSGFREGDMRYIFSIFCGFWAYTLLWRVILASLLLPRPNSVRWLLGAD